MIKNFEDLQRLGQENVDTANRLFAESAKGWQTIAADMTLLSALSKMGLLRSRNFSRPSRLSKPYRSTAALPNGSTVATCTNCRKSVASMPS